MRPEYAIDKILDRLMSGVMLFSASGDLVYSNAATACYGRDDFLPIDGSDHYFGIGNPNLKNAISTVLLDGKTVVKTILPPIGEIPPVVAAVMAIRSADATTTDLFEVACVVFLSPADLPCSLAAALVGQAYNLTAAETRLLHLLLEGKTLDEAAGELAVKRATVATHLKSTFTKVDVQRQSDLVRLAWRMSPLAD